MASIRKLSSGKYQVCWRENVRDEYGAAIAGKFVQRTETLTDPKKAERRKVAIELEIESGHDPSASKSAAQQPLAHYARMYFDALTAKISDRTLMGYRDIYRVHIQPTFANRPVSSILPSDIESWVSMLLLGISDTSRLTGGGVDSAETAKPRHEKTVKQALGVLRRILRKAVLDKAITANPTAEVRVSTSQKQRQRSTATNAATTNGKTREAFQHHPLTAGQVAAVSDYIANEQGNPVFALAVTFAAFTGVRAAELAGLEIGDLTLSEIPGTVGAVRVSRTKTRSREKGHRSEWITDSPKSVKSIRTIPLDAWLADDLRTYLATYHSGDGKNLSATAPLFPGRLNRHRASQLGRKFSDPVDMLDWDSPIVPEFVYETNFKPALDALGFPAARWHDLRHSYAVMSLSAGEHYMQVSKWLGHATFTLTLDTYGDYISSAEGGKSAPLTRPQPTAVVVRSADVVPMNRKAN